MSVSSRWHGVRPIPSVTGPVEEAMPRRQTARCFFSASLLPSDEDIFGFSRRLLNGPTMMSPVTPVVQALLATALLPGPRELPILERSPVA